MPTVLGSFTADVQFEGDCVFTGEIVVNQLRDDADPPVSVDADVTFSRDLYDAVTGPVRWVASKIMFNGQEIVIGRGMAISMEDSLDAIQRTMKFALCGDEWAIPSSDFVPPDPSTCPVVLPVTARTSPRSIGNKPTELYIKLGSTPAKMFERKLFQGESASKSNRGSVQTVGEINSVDDSMLYANVPLCLEIPPFSGLRRDEIVRLAAANVGLDPVADVTCPIGKVVTKPILLTNASLLPFLNDFILAENWRAYFDENGKLVVEPVELKVAPLAPDWELLAERGDFDLDSFEEIPPTQSATRIIVTVTQPVSGTGPGGSGLTQTVRTTESSYELYAPECVKVRPSGGDSNLFGDGSYRTIPVEQLMLVQKKITDTTTVNGQETRRAVTVFQFYNPRAWDPNFDVYPTTASYDGAYGDHSFHLDEAELFREVSYDSIETTRDIYGTILKTVETSKDWYAPHRALTFYSTSRTALLGDAGATPPSYIFAGGTARTVPAEQYLVVSKVEKLFTYGQDGTLSSILETQTGYYAPDSRSDITVNDDDPVDQVPEDPPYETPPPSPPPDTGASWYPILTGPTSDDGQGTFTFKVSIVGGPPGGPLTTSVVLQAYKAQLANVYPNYQPIPGHGLPGVSGDWHSGNGQGVLLVPGSIEEGVARITFRGPKPAAPIYVGFAINRTGTTHGFSNNIVFDPWAGVPEGGVL